MDNARTKYVVRVTVDSAEAAGQVAAAAAGEGCTEIRYDALERGERRPLTKDELAVTVQLIARATDERRRRGA